MAINNWRYVVTWWYMEPDWTIVEERQWVPNVNVETTQPTTTSSPTFSPAEAFRLQSVGYGNMGDTAMSNVFGDMANSLWAYSNYANTTLGAYDKLLNFIAGNESKLQWVAWNLYNNLVNDINTQRDYVYSMFWPNGTLTKEVNTYYDDLWNYLSTDAWRQAAKIAAQWIHSWASLWAIRAQQNEAYNESFGRYVQAKEQQINAKQQIASNLINFMSTLRQEYWDTTNQYVIELYKRANDLYNNVALSVAQDLDSYNKLRLSSWWGGNSTSSLLNSLWLLPKDENTLVDAAWNEYRMTENWGLELVSWWLTKNEAEAKLWQTANNLAKDIISMGNNAIQKSKAPWWMKQISKIINLLYW